MTVALPVATSSKVLLLNEMLRQHVRPVILAKRLGTTPQEVNRIIDLQHNTKIDSGRRCLVDAGKAPNHTRLRAQSACARQPGPRAGFPPRMGVAGMSE